MIKDLRAFKKLLEAEEEIKRISEPVSTEYEIASILKKHDGEKAASFANVKGFELEVVGNLCCRKDFVAKGLGVSLEQLTSRIIQAAKAPLAPRIFNNGASQESEVEDVDFYHDLPILTHHEHDRGPYITSSIIIAKDPETGRPNASYHRMLLAGKEKLIARLVEGRDLHRFYSKSKDLGKPLEAAVIIGAPLELLVAAAMSYGDVCELDLAGGLAETPLELVRCRTIDVEVPRYAEIVIEGRLLFDQAEEGPFVDITGSYDTVREQPVFEVQLMTRRDDAFYQAILPSGSEHKLLMGMPKEAQICDKVGDISDVVGVALTPIGSNWLDVAISIRKRHPQEPYLTAMAAIAAHYSLKRVVIVDEDIDVNDQLSVEKAVIERAHPVEDYFVVKNAKGSTLDKSGIRSEGARLPPAKIIIDATIKGKKEFFEIGKIPKS